MIKSKQIHCGQYKSYGDFFRVWIIETDCKDRKKVLEYCFTNIYKHRVPENEEWNKNIRFGGEKFEDYNYYFAGWYALETIRAGFKFTICEPFAD